MQVDLRSDTVTRPTPAMREAMAAAAVGDDVYGEDETVNELERRAAQAMRPRGGAVRAVGHDGQPDRHRMWAGRGDEVYAHRDAHILSTRRAATSALWGAQTRWLQSSGFALDDDELAEAVPMDASDIHRPRARLLCIENTHTGSGGRVWTAAALARVTARARALGLRVHMDGARLPNAAVARGCTLAEASAGADSVSFCFSKGLGAPVGSMLVASAAAIARGAPAAQAARRRHAAGRRARGRGPLCARPPRRAPGRGP